MKIFDELLDYPESYVELPCPTNEKLLSRETAILTDDKLDFLVPIMIKSVFKRDMIIFDSTGLSNLSKYFSNVLLTQRLFSRLMRNVILSYKNIKHLKFNLDKIIYDSNYLMIDPLNWKIHYFYVPCESYKSSGNIIKLLIDVMSCLRFSPTENCDYARGFIELLTSKKTVTEYDAEQYLNMLEDNLNISEYQCKSCGKLLLNGENICPVCGERVIRRSKQGDISVSQPIPTLKNQTESIQIFSNPFRIGKSPSNNLVIQSDIISGVHAEIIAQKGNYYIRDLNSTNGTYINRERISPHTTKILTNECTIAFANIEYRFYLK